MGAMFARTARSVYGAIAFAVFLTVMVIVCGLIISGPTLAIRRAIGRAGIRCAFASIGCPIRVQGLEFLPAQPAIVVSNHASYLDGLVMTAALPARFTFLVQSGAAGWPLVGITIRRMGVRFVNRGSPREAAAAMKDLIDRAQKGESFTIFAEGTFKRPPGLLAFQSGAFLIAAKSGLPIVPTVICGTRKILPEDARLFTRATVQVRVLPALMTQGQARDAAARLRDAARTAILAHCGEPDAAHAEAPPAAANEHQR